MTSTPWRVALRGGFRILILAACVPLTVPPGVCLCDAAEHSHAPGHRHSHGHHDHCCCIGELALDEDDSVRPATAFELAPDLPVAFHPVPPDAFAPTSAPVKSVPPSGFPRLLTHFALRI